MRYHIQIPEHLGKALRSQRKHLKLSQKEVAKQVGLLPKTISHLENNPTKASIGSLCKLLTALKMNIVLVPEYDKNSQANQMEW